MWPCLSKGCLYYLLSWNHLSHGPVPRGSSGCCWNLIRCNAIQRSRRAVFLIWSDLVDFHTEGVHFQRLRKVFQNSKCQNFPNHWFTPLQIHFDWAITSKSYMGFPGWNRSHQELNRTYFPIPTLHCGLRSRRCSTNGSGANGVGVSTFVIWFEAG